MKKYILIILASLTNQTFAQLPSYEPFLYLKGIPNEGRAVANRFLGESHVKYSKRIHRVIDSRQKQNKDISWPRNPTKPSALASCNQRYTRHRTAQGIRK